MPTLGENYKVHLPGESPWAECLAVNDDGSWDGRIINKLFREYSLEERKGWMGDNWETEQLPPELHQYRQNQIIRFVQDQELNIWIPADQQPRMA